MNLSSKEILALIHKHFPNGMTIRKPQEVACFKAIRGILAGVKHIVIEAPTGVGKSAIAYTIASVMREIVGYRTSIITKTKMLQDVYRESFGTVIYDVKGKANYGCPHEAVHYGTPDCMRNKKEGRCAPARDCEYYITRKYWSEKASIRSTNNNFFLDAGAKVLIGEKYESQLLIIDEAHTLPGTIIDSANMIFDMEYLVNLQKATKVNIIDLRMGFLRVTNYISGLEQDYMVVDEKLMELLIEAIKKMAPTVGKLMETAEENDDDKLMTALGPIQDLMTNMMTIRSSAVGSEYHIYERGAKVVIKPYHASYVADHKLLRKSQFFIHMSATICGAEKYMENYNVKPHEFLYVGLDTPYPVENRQVYYTPCGTLNNSNREEMMPYFVAAIDTIASMFPLDRGIIHSVTYDNAKLILDLSEMSDRMYIPSDPYDGIRFLKTNPSGILVSPSIEEGVDLKDDLSRFQVLVKVPFGYLPDPIIAKQFEVDKRSYSREAVTRIVQASGRSIRSETDIAETFILDRAFDRLFDREKDLFPKWYLDAVIEYSSFNAFLKSIAG